MHGHGKSDNPVVPKKHPNKGCEEHPAEGAEGRGLAKGNPDQQTRSRTQCREDLQQALRRIRQAATKDRKQRFTAIWHHVYDVNRLREEFGRINPDAAPGVDGQTWRQYGEDLESDGEDLSGRLKRGAYRAKPVGRAWIPKPDGRQRPIGVTALEDKIVQRAVVAVIQEVYEVEFKGFSHGFRPEHGAHNALDALAVGIWKMGVEWVLDADIRGFFDAINHEWLLKFIEHRIADKRVLRHIKKWLKAGVLEGLSRAAFVSPTRRRNLVSRPQETGPEAPHDLATNATHCGPLATSTANSASSSLATPARQLHRVGSHLRQEPYEVVPHVRI